MAFERKLGNGWQKSLVALLVVEPNRLRESAEYEMAQLVEKQPGLLDTVAAKRIAALEAELADLKTKAERLATEIEELTGEPATSIG